MVCKQLQIGTVETVETVTFQGWRYLISHQPTSLQADTFAENKAG